MTKPLTAIKSYVSSRAHAITHLTKKSCRTALNLLLASVTGGFVMGVIYAIAVSTENLNKIDLTVEQGKIFAIIMFGIGMPISALLFDILMYNIDRDNMECCC